MLNDFVMVIDDLISKEDCELYIEWIEHYISHSVMLKESNKLHDRDHETLNFSNDDAFDLNSSDKFLISIIEFKEKQFASFNVLFAIPDKTFPGPTSI